MKNDSTPPRAGIADADLILIDAWQRAALGIATPQQIAIIQELTADGRCAAEINNRARLANEKLDVQRDLERTSDLRESFDRADKIFARLHAADTDPQVLAAVGRSSEALLRRLCAVRIGASKKT
jgi:hypothetical protein